jgi:hypothetical protein
MLEAEVGRGLAHLGGRIAADLIAEASRESTYADPNLSEARPDNRLMQQFLAFCGEG